MYTYSFAFLCMPKVKNLHFISFPFQLCMMLYMKSLLAALWLDTDPLTHSYERVGSRFSFHVHSCHLNLLENQVTREIESVFTFVHFSFLSCYSHVALTMIFQVTSAYLHWTQWWGSCRTEVTRLLTLALQHVGSRKARKKFAFNLRPSH